MFHRYVSNTPVGTGTNFILETGAPHPIRARAFLRPEVCGTFRWRLFWVNSVNSTFADGAVAFRNKSGGSWEIRSVRMAVCTGEAGTDELTDFVPVTFDGSRTRSVSPDERFWSDEFVFTVPEGARIVYDCELYGDGVPCTPDSRVTAFLDEGDGYKTEDSCRCPLPALFGCDRPVKKTVAFLGDSITQGCGTGRDQYESWCARIAAMLAPDYAVWNLGLGWGRAADALTDESWLYKAKQADIVVLTLGVNDLLHGAYHEGHPSTAGEVVAALDALIVRLQSAGCTVILSTLPPFSFSPEGEKEWRAVELAIRPLAALHGCRVYDIESSLDATLTLGNVFPFGAHPDGRGGEAAAEAFRRTFLGPNGWTL